MTLQRIERQQVSANVVLLSLAAIKLLIHILVNAFGAYGYFRDELYYIACTEHPGIGYVDQPPFSIYLLTANRFLFGDALVALRLLPALAGAATVFLSGLIARELGDGRFAQMLAALAVLLSPIYLGMDSIYSMNAFDILLWTAAIYTLIRILKSQFDTEERHPERSPDDSQSGRSRRMIPARPWLLLGLILGIGLLNKIGVLWLGAGIAVGLAFTPHRRWFATRWPWIAAGIAFLIFLPYIIWNATHNFTHLEFIRNATGEKYASQNAITFLSGQLLINNPVALPLWLAGLFFFFGKDQKLFRPLGIVYVVALAILLVNGHSKSEYLSPAYTMLFAGGGVVFERLSMGRRWVKLLSIGVLTVSGCILAPMATPLLPVESYIRYAEVLGLKPTSSEGKQMGRLPQFYADMFGWEEKTAAVARVFNTLSPEEKEKCAIFADNYGRCAAIDFFGPKYGLPKSIGNHNSYWIWGPGNTTGDVVIILGGNPDDHRRSFESVVVADTSSCTYCMPYENHLAISVCRRLKIPVQEAWARARHYD